MEEAKTTLSETEALVGRFATWYTPIVLGLAVVLGCYKVRVRVRVRLRVRVRVRLRVRVRVRVRVRGRDAWGEGAWGGRRVVRREVKREARHVKRACAGREGRSAAGAP